MFLDTSMDETSGPGKSNTMSQDGLVKVYSPQYKRPGSLVGYTGHYSAPELDDDELDSPQRKVMIRGYTGFRPNLKNVCGTPLIPSEEKQLEALSPVTKSKPRRGDIAVKEGENYNFRSFAKHMDIMERYGTAVHHLLRRGQSQEMLLRIVQAKMSERVNSFSQQLIRTRRLFELHDINGDGVLDEGEFRICLEQLNIQFDDVQNLALFAYFDDNNDGFVEWEDFADHAMVPNPKGGTAVNPKVITDVVKTDKFTKKREELHHRHK